MNYDVRLPGYGGAGVFLRRTIAGDPPGLPGIDLWLLGPDFCEAVLRRATDADLLPRLAKHLFAVASASAPERDLAAFQDVTAGVSVDVGASDEERIGLTVRVVEDLEADVVESYEMEFETSRAALAATAEQLAELAGGLDLVDFEGLS